jgi:hypothetical protein
MSCWTAHEWTYPQMKGGKNEHVQRIRQARGMSVWEGRAGGMAAGGGVRGSMSAGSGRKLRPRRNYVRNVVEFRFNV